MKITILQRNIEWANPQVNVARADEAISCLPDSDLFVLPEMFSTGFCTQPEGIAESAENEGYQYAGISSCLGGKRYDAETVRSQGQSYKPGQQAGGDEQPLDESYFYSHEFAEQ